MLTQEQLLMQKLSTDVELLKQEAIHTKQMLDRIDSFTDKISNATLEISKLLSLHEHKVAVMEESISNVEDNMDSFHTSVIQVKHEFDKKLEGFNKDLSDRLKIVEEDTKDLKKYKYYAVAILGAVYFVFDHADKITEFLK